MTTSLPYSVLFLHIEDTHAHGYVQIYTKWVYCRRVTSNCYCNPCYAMLCYAYNTTTQPSILLTVEYLFTMPFIFIVVLRNILSYTTLILYYRVILLYHSKCGYYFKNYCTYSTTATTLLYPLFSSNETQARLLTTALTNYLLVSTNSTKLKRYRADCSTQNSGLYPYFCRYSLYLYYTIM